jgi:transposase-like protein
MPKRPIEQRRKIAEGPLPEFPANLLEFQRMFPDEAACLSYLRELRWPSGFVCESCGSVGEPFTLTTRPRVVKCRACERETSVTAGTILHGTKTSLLAWFWAAYLVATQTSGISALELQKQLGIADYETAFALLHKLRAAMVRLDPDPIGAQWPTEMDISFVGGKHKGQGSGRTHKLPVIIAVEVRRTERHDPQTGKLVERALAGRIRLRQVPNKTAAVVETFAKDCIAPGAVIRTDDGGEFETLRACGYQHQPLPMRGDRSRMDAWLPMVSTVTGNLKAWLDGTFHGVGKQHLQAYLNEFMFRFNRRFHRALSFRTLLGLGSVRLGPTYRSLYHRD